MADREIQQIVYEVECYHIRDLYFKLFNFLQRNGFNVSEANITDEENYFAQRFASTSTGPGSDNFNEYRNQCACIGKYISTVACLIQHATLEFLNDRLTLKITSELLQKDSLLIVFIGGGRIDEILGVCSALGNNPRYTDKPVKCHIVDSCSGWKDLIIKSIDMITQNCYGINSDIINRRGSTWNCCFGNLTLESKKMTELAIKSADLVVAVKNVSEPEHVTNTLQVTFNLMKPGAVFLGIETGFNKNEHFSEQEIYEDMECIYREGCTGFILPTSQDLDAASERNNSHRDDTDERMIYYKTYAARKVETYIRRNGA